MKNLHTFEEFLNESQLNERTLDPDEFSILSIGILKIKTGKSKFFNVYDEWKGQDKTVEIYRETYPNKGMINLVITSGKSPIKNANGKEPVEGDQRPFFNQQTGKSIFVGEYLVSMPLEDLKNTNFFQKIGMNSDAFRAFVYK
jgi:hypothetical protein